MGHTRQARRGGTAKNGRRKTVKQGARGVIGMALSRVAAKSSAAGDGIPGLTQYISGAAGLTLGVISDSPFRCATTASTMSASSSGPTPPAPSAVMYSRCHPSCPSAVSPLHRSSPDP